MHELSIAQEIVTIALREAGEAGAKKILSVRVKVGEFTSVEPEPLRFCFAALTGDTAAAGAALVVERIPLVVECLSCHSPFVPESFCFRCPRCRSTEVRITSGRELQVESIEVE